MGSQIDPSEVSEYLRKAKGCIPLIRPGFVTKIYIKRTLDCMSFLNSIFLCILALIPKVSEDIINVYVIKDIGSTSILITIGIITDFVRKLNSDLLLEKYDDFNKLYF